MTFDASKPVGSEPIAQGDNEIRTNNEGLQEALDLEHEFVDAQVGEQSGRHKFGVGLTVGFPPAPPTGALAFSTDDRNATPPVLFVYDGTNWVAIDVNPLGPSPFLGTAPILPRTNEVNLFEEGNHATWTSITANIDAGPNPNELPISIDDTPLQNVVISQDTLIQSPTGVIASIGTIILLDLQMSGGPHEITWGANYRSKGSVIAVDNPLSGDGRTMFTLTILNGGNTWLTSVPAFDGSGVVSV